MAFYRIFKAWSKKKVLFMHKVFSQSKDLENLYWLHRSSLLVYHTILERHISVIIYDHAICQCHNNVLFYISKILCSWCHLRGRTGKSFHCLHTVHQYWHFHLIKVWKCEKKRKKTKQTKKTKHICVVATFISNFKWSHCIYCFALPDLLGLFVIRGAFLKNVTFILLQKCWNKSFVIYVGLIYYICNFQL